MSVFDTYSNGVKSNRDFWVYNFDHQSVKNNMARMLDFYAEQVAAYKKSTEGLAKEKWPDVEKFANNDPKRISWNRSLKNDLGRMTARPFRESAIVPAMYRPFCKQWLYFDRALNDMVYQMPKLFPKPGLENTVIAVKGIGANRAFSALAANVVVDLEMISKGQVFPFYYYEPVSENDTMFVDGEVVDGYVRREAISDKVLSAFRKQYDEEVTKRDIFAYVYGILHSAEYKSRFDIDLKKVLPRIPLVQDFWAFSRAGKHLLDLHLNYEVVEPYELGGTTAQLGLDPKTDNRVIKMRFAKQGKMEDRTAIVVNGQTTLTGIPEEAYDYQVNGKSAIEWIMERYQHDTDKPSGITNDPNDWAAEHGDPAYIVNLVKRICTVSVETMKIVKALPPLNEKRV